LRVLLANPRGFCAGVDRAIKVVDLALDVFDPPIYVRREIVHNSHVVGDFREKGVIFVDELDEVPNGAVAILSAHGVAPAVFEQARARSLRLIDATCPLVTKVHLEVHRFLRQGFHIVLIGHEGHDEVIGTMGEAPGRITLVENETQARSVDLSRHEKLMVLTQTTLGVDDTRVMLDGLAHRRPLLNGDSGFMPRPYDRAMELLEGPVGAEALRFLRAVDVRHVVAAGPIGLPEVVAFDGESVFAVPPGVAALVVAPEEPVATWWTGDGPQIELAVPRRVDRVVFELSDAPWVANPRVEASVDGVEWEPLEARAASTWARTWSS